MKTRISVVLLAAFWCLTGCDKSEDRGPVVATVGEESLTLQELLEEIPDHIRANLTSVEIREFILRWINKQVLYQEALERELDEDADVRKELQKVKKELMINKLMELTVDNDVSVSDDEIEAYYEANKDRFVLEEDIAHAYHIVVETQSQANEVRRRLNQGENFEDIFTDVKSDSVNDEHWDLGWFRRDDVIPEIANVVFKMAVGSHSYPFKSDFGYHIVKLIERQKEGEVRHLDAVNEEIRHILEARKLQDRQRRFTMQMKSKFKIETNFQLLESAEMDSILTNSTGSN